MAEISIQQGSVGTVIEVKIVDSDLNIVSLVGASSKLVKFKKPDRTIVSKDVNFLTDGSDGIVSYSTESGLLDQSGMWSMQVVISLISGSYYPSDIISFKVLANI